MRMQELGERSFLEKIRRFTGKRDSLELGFGDDAAVIRCAGGEKTVLTTDMLIEDVHFSRAFQSFHELGRKSYEVNASDVAAMGAYPTMAFLSLGIPPDTSLDQLLAFYRGFQSGAGRQGCIIAGGDTVGAESLSISVAMLGRFEDGARPVLRSGARPGQTIYVTGWPGESGMGLELLKFGKAAHIGYREGRRCIRRHLLPSARVEAGLRLARSDQTGAMIDVSDGVYNELTLLARSSKVGMVVEEENLPISRALRRAARIAGFRPLDMVLFGGEDYELVFTSSLNPEKVRRLLKGLRTVVHAIGRVQKGKAVSIRDASGRLVSLEDRTFHHFQLKK